MASCAHLSQAHYTPSVQGKNIYKDQCSKCFDSPKTKGGIFVCLKCFNSFCVAQHLQEHKQKHPQHVLFLHVEMFELPPPEGGYEINKIAIGKEGGALGGVEYQTKYSFFCQPCNLTVPDISTIEDKSVAGLLQSLINSESAYKKQALVSWQLEERPCEHTLTLQQNPGDINLSKCGECELSSGLWLCLTCGHIGCARKNYDGSGGNNHGVEHYEKTKHPLVVKSGTITADGKASIHCYECSDEVHDNDLAAHLRVLGINISEQKKTEKTILELTLDMNLNVALSRLVEDAKMTPLYGKGYTGIDNIGNSCYINSVLQALFSLEEYHQVYYQKGVEHLNSCPKIPNDCFYCQISKVANGLYSGKYSQPLTRINIINNEPVQEVYQHCLQPYDFKVMIAKNHQDFSSQQQQDALQYLQFLFDRLVKEEKWIDANTTKEFQFLNVNKLICINCNGVKYNKTKTNEWKFPVPHPTQEQLQEFQKKLEGETDEKIKESKKNDEPEYFTTFEKCLDIFRQGDVVEAHCPNCKKQSAFRSLQLFGSTPRYLIGVANRFVMDNWSAKKLNAVIDMKEVFNIEEFLAQNNKEGGKQIDQNSEAPNYSEHNIEAITGMGFSANAAIRALVANQDNVEVACAWLYEHLEDADINDPLPKKQSGPPSASPDLVEQIVNFGFTHQQATVSLTTYGNNLQLAVNFLMDGGDIESLKPAAPQGGNDKIENSKLYTKYELHAVIVHLGKSVHSGHYVVYIRKNGKWVLYNDSRVLETSEPALGKGYIYIYRGV